MSKLFMFTGSSSVGKSMTLHSVKHKVDVRELTARTVRESFGNPDWSEIIASRKLADEIQMAQLNYFLDRLNAVADEMYAMAESFTRPVVFERSPWDVMGYSLSFCCSPEVIIEQKEKILAFEQGLIDRGLSGVLVTFSIDPHYPYDFIPARPPENIRILCDEYLKQCWEFTQLRVMSRNIFLLTI